MHYLGYRVLTHGNKIYCLRSEKNPSRKKRKLSKASTPSLVVSKRQDHVGHHELAAGDLAGPSAVKVKTRSMTKRKETFFDTCHEHLPMGATKMAQPRPDGLALLEADQEPTASDVSPHHAMPDWVQRAQEVHPAACQQNSPQQQHQQQASQPAANPVDWVLSVARSLRNRSDLDRSLLGRYLSIFGRFSKGEQEIYGKIILELAADTSVVGLHSLLESAV
jgi:hypothetical protein